LLEDGKCFFRLLVKGNWIGAFSFEYPFRFITDEEVIVLYENTFTTKYFSLLRDRVIKGGRVIEEGRIGYDYFPKEATFNAIKNVFIRGENYKTTFASFADYKADIEKTLRIRIPDEEEIDHSKSTTHD